MDVCSSNGTGSSAQFEKQNIFDDVMISATGAGAEAGVAW